MESASTLAGWSGKWRSNITDSKSFDRPHKNDSIALGEARLELSKLDTVTPKGNFLEYLLDEEYIVHIVWGSKTRGVIDTFHTEITLWYAHEFHSEWPDYIGVMYNYGRHNELALLPLNTGDSIREIWEVHDADPKQNLLVLRTMDGMSYPTEFALMNIQTNRMDSIQFSQGLGVNEVEDWKNPRFIQNGYVFDVEVTYIDGSPTTYRLDTLRLK